MILHRYISCTTIIKNKLGDKLNIVTIQNIIQNKLHLIPVPRQDRAGTINLKGGLVLYATMHNFQGPMIWTKEYRLHGGNEFMSLMNMFSTDVVSDQRRTVNKLSFISSERRPHALNLT